MHIIEMLLLISLLIIVHEAGHFFVARAFRIRVDRVGFGLPIGPTLFEKKIGDITYCIHAFLLGGYVGFPDDDPNSKIPLDDPDRIANRPAWQKALVVSAGVTMNVIFAYLIVFFVAFASGSLPSGRYEILINSVQDGDVPAKVAAFEKNDKLVFVNGIKISNPMIFQEVAQRSKKFDGYVEEEDILAQVENIKKTNPSLKINKEEKLAEGIIINIPQARPEKYITVEEDYYLRNRPTPSGVELTEQEAKLRDELAKEPSYKSDGTFTLYELAKATADTTHPLSIEVERNGKIIRLKDVHPNEKGIIGIYQSIAEIETPVNSFEDGIIRSHEYIVRNTVMMVEGLVKLVIGKVSPDNLHGIVAIVKLGGDTIKQSIWDGLLLTSLISIDLAIINLLPIPALDGGYLLFIVLEKILRRPLHEEITENISKYCFLALILLMILVVFNDIWALITKKF